MGDAGGGAAMGIGEPGGGVIMPMDRNKYPENWEAISIGIRMRAHWICEFCGAVNGEPHPETGSKVVLTVAHLDHNTWNCDPGNLRALCQRCHLHYDLEHHMETRRERERRELIENGQMELFL